MLPKKILLFLLLISIVGVGSADSNLNPTGASDQTIINQALESGGTVHLNAGTYVIDGPIYIGSNTKLEGDKDAIIQVPSSSSQWFTGSTGIISTKDPQLKNVEICGFQIDGNLDQLPTSYANEGGGDHNAERLIYLKGSSDSFMDSISIHDMQIYDAYSDGIHVAFANNVNVYNNFVSNCQHSGIYFVSVTNGIIKGNEVAGITSDCVRIDNGVNIIVTDNVLYSYTGDNSNGAYQKGENALQVGDQGYSHGGGSEKPTTTTNIEVYNNTFANTGLRSIWVDASGKGVDNVYVHDNKFLSGEELATRGMPVEAGNVSYVNPPSVELSRRIFSSIFDALDLTYANFGRTNQTENQINYKVVETPKGKITGGIKIVGFKDMIMIDNKSYIPDKNSTMVKYRAVPSMNLSDITSKTSTKVDVRIENGTAYATLTVKMEWFRLKKNAATGKYTKRNYSTTATFNDSCPAPDVLIRPTEIKGLIYQYPTFFRVTVPSKGLVNVKYTYDGNTSQHNCLVGTRNYTETGVEFTEYSRFDYWEGTLRHENNFIYVLGEFDRSKLNVTALTPYEELEVTDFDIIKKDYPKEIISKWFYIQVFFSGWCLIFLWWLIKQTF